jgi:hypothetical protein
MAREAFWPLLSARAAVAAEVSKGGRDFDGIEERGGAESEDQSLKGFGEYWKLLPLAEVCRLRVGVTV